MACRATACGLHSLGQSTTHSLVPSLARLSFVGLDVSSQNLGVCVLKLVRDDQFSSSSPSSNQPPKIEVRFQTTAKLPKRKAGGADGRENVLLRRAEAVHRVLEQVPVDLPDVRVAIEDRLVTTFGSSGVIGKQTLVGDAHCTTTNSTISLSTSSIFHFVVTAV